MGRQALITVLCLLATKRSLSEPTVLETLTQDNVGAESAPRLYRNVAVYARNAPYAAYSIQMPTFLTAPRTAASSIVPVKEIFQNTGYLRDSYGNRFVGAPQSFAYKAAFPQQFLKLQALPSHLSQPLVAASPSYQYNHPSPFVVGSHYTLPLQGASSQHFSAPQQVAYPGAIKNIVSTSSNNAQLYGHPTAQQQSTSNNAVYANVHPQQQYRGLPFQRLQDNSKDVQIIQEGASGYNKQVIQKNKEQLQAAPKDAIITTVVNGQKTVINLETKPPLPLLDISLLEPLTFDNPLVPQVQHFLPRINQATYHKLPKPNIKENKNYQNEFAVQKTKSYDSGIKRGKSRKVSPKKKQKRPSPESEIHQREEPINPTVTIKDVSNVKPEISYEINSPNYKETYNEQAISYNKETQSEPVHYTYGSKTEKKPVTYSYVHSSKEPLKIKDSHYQNDGQDPKQLIYHFKPEENPKEQNDKTSHELESLDENNESEEEEHVNTRPIEQQERREEPLNTHHHNSEQREEEYHHPPNQEQHRDVQDNPDHFYSQPHQIAIKNAEQFHPITHYEENIRLLPEHKTARIKVDPTQHIQDGQAHNPQSDPKSVPQEQTNQSPEPNNYEHDDPPPSSRPHTTAPQHIQEKSRRVIIQEETPEEMRSLREQVMAEVIDEQENNEEDFEKAYKNAAYGFPAYRNNPTDSEKQIYNPESYGVPRDDYDIEHVPFEQYQDEGDEYPKTTRSNYKDSRDKTKENYYLDFAVSRPESLTDRYRNKEDYYKLYKEQKPERYVSHDDDRQKENEKYTATQYVFKPVPEQKPKQTFAKYKAAPQSYQYNYPKEAPRDNSAYASRPLQQYKAKTYFVEPQFQYGFEPLVIPRLLDSELAAMATNHSPESEKPGMRKKVYKENWYIKKTRTAGGDNS